MLTVLVVSPNRARLPDPVPPIGAAYVAQAARMRGHDVRIHDSCFDRDPERQLAVALESLRPDVVGISLRNVDECSIFAEGSFLPVYAAAVRVVRAHAPGARVVLGGSAFTLFPEQYVAVLGADHGIAGEGEEAFADLLDAIDTGRAPPRGTVLPGRPAAAGCPVRPARDLIDVRRYHREGGSTNLQTKRGCGFRCTYCAYPSLEGSRVRARDPADVVDEIEEVLVDRGIDCFFFVDSVFNVPSGHALRISREITRRSLPITWTAYLTPAGASAELYAAMAESGCRSVDFGTDAASPRTLRALGKGFGVSDIEAASSLCREHGILFSHSLVLGGPGETWASLDETVERVAATRPTAVIASAGVRLLPGTALLERAIAEGKAPPRGLGLEPVFWVSEDVREGLPEALPAIASRHQNWVVPGLTLQVGDRARARLRARGARGPLWEQIGH